MQEAAMSRPVDVLRFKSDSSECPCMVGHHEGSVTWTKRERLR
jgi:hypothetical protein